MGVVTVTATSSIEDAVTITDGTGAAATTSTGTTAAIVIIIIADGVFAAFAIVTHCPGDARMQRCERVAPSRRGRFSRH
jgi:hypothetical protein